MKLTEVAITLAVTLGVAAAALTAMDPARLQDEAEVTVSAATCRSIDNAISAYIAEQNVVPTQLSEIRKYVRGDISAYRIDRGNAVGPGCAAPEQ